jgi:UDP-N-acetyl-D-glucosamine dehydrogenase
MTGDLFMTGSAGQVLAPASVGVVGLGYVGLPVAVAFAEAGLAVVGVEKDPDRVAALDAGDSYVADVPAERIKPLTVSSGRLRPTGRHEALAEVDAVVICLPTPLDEHREPDLSAVVEGVGAVARHLRPGALVVLESTTYPGTTREVVMPILGSGGRRVGEDFYLAFSPERIDPGNRRYTLENTPRVVGGVTPECARRARALYAAITGEIHEVSTPEAAELAKLLENVFRGVNIALINELAILCHRMGVDVWEVIEAAKTKPFGFMPFYPGPGLGGHCVPVDPFYLSWRARAYDTTTEFIELAGRLNVRMPYYAVRRIADALNADRKPLNGSRVFLLGASYKPNVGDTRESPSLKMVELLRGAGASVAYHDPHVPDLPELGLRSVELSSQELGRADCVVIATDHDAVDLGAVVEAAPKVLDLRNAVRRRLGGPLPAHVDVL